MHSRRLPRILALVLVVACGALTSVVSVVPASAATGGSSTVTGRVLEETPDGSTLPSAAGDLQMFLRSTVGQVAPPTPLERRPDGTFTFSGVTAGTWFVVLTPPRPGPYRTAQVTRKFTVPEGVSAIAVGDLVLSLSSSLSGRVTTGSGARAVPVPQATVTVFLRDPVTGLYPARGISSNASHDGSWTISGLGRGTYRIEVGDPTWISPRVHDDSFWPSGLRATDASDIVLGPGGSVTGLDVVLVDRTVATKRIAGVDRFATAAAALASDWGFPTTDGVAPDVPVLYVASGRDFPDALSAGPAAAHQGGALLLVERESVPAETAAAITRLSPDELVVVGGEAAVSSAVFAELASLQPAITRLAGADRYETSRLVARHAFAGPAPVEDVFVATGSSFPDALSAGPAAHRSDAPVVLVRGQEAAADAPTMTLLDDLGTSEVHVVGGAASIRTDVESSLHGDASRSVFRVAGADRFGTSVALAGGSSETVFVANGRGFADALVAGAVAARAGASLLLSEQGCVPAVTRDAVLDADVHTIVLVGGPAVLGPGNEAVASVCGG